MNAKKREFKMNLLNAEEIKGVTGGAVGQCQKTGDAILTTCNPNNHILCATVEITCPGGVSMNCGSTSFAYICGGAHSAICISGFSGCFPGAF